MISNMYEDDDPYVKTLAGYYITSAAVISTNVSYDWLFRLWSPFF